MSTTIDDVIQFYANNGLTKDIDIVLQIYNKLSKKKKTDFTQLIEMMSRYNTHHVNYIQKIGQVEFQDIEIILNLHEYIDFGEKDDLIMIIKHNLDHENITYDAARILYCLCKELVDNNKKHVLQIITFLVHQKMNIKPIEFNEIQLPKKNDIEWLLWKILFVYSSKISKTVNTYVSLQMKIYSMNWTKKQKLHRVNILLFTFALLSSKNIKKYIPEKNVTSDDNLSYIFCYIPKNEKLIAEVQKDRELYAEQEYIRSSTQKLCHFESNCYTSESN